MLVCKLAARGRKKEAFGKKEPIMKCLHNTNLSIFFGIKVSFRLVPRKQVFIEKECESQDDLTPLFEGKKTPPPEEGKLGGGFEGRGRLKIMSLEPSFEGDFYQFWRNFIRRDDVIRKIKNFNFEINVDENDLEILQSHFNLVSTKLNTPIRNLMPIQIKTWFIANRVEYI